jgi:HAMP domain-containing protein
MLLAPVLAIALAFLLAGAISSLSFLPQSASQGQPSPEPTSFPNSTMAPLPTSQPAPQSVSPLNSNLVPILFIVAAIVVGVVAAILLFSEKTLNKETSGK